VEKAEGSGKRTGKPLCAQATIGPREHESVEKFFCQRSGRTEKRERRIYHQSVTENPDGRNEDDRRQPRDRAFGRD
jgi:hypothetical protein